MNTGNLTKLFKPVWGFVACLIAIHSGVAQGKDFPARTELYERSLKKGLNADEIQLLQRLPGPGRDLVVDTLAARFASSRGSVSTAGPWRSVERAGKSSLLGNGWRIKVWADGSKFTYFNQEATRKPGYPVLSIEDRFSNRMLEDLGRKFISASLGDLVVLRAGEELVPLFTEFEVAGGTSAKGRMEEEKVLSSIVHFGRRIQGVAVVGAGSRISVYVGNDGEPFGFDVDWPGYEQAGITQKTLPVDHIYERLSAFGSMSPGAEQVELQRMECGYLDAGAQQFDPQAPIQAGCVAHTVGSKMDKKTGTRLISAVVNDVPAGEQVQWDDRWPETQLVLAHGDACLKTELSDCIP